MFVLEEMWPYPHNETPIEDTQFLVYQFEEDEYIIMDQEICEDEHISGKLLAEEGFNLLEWYATQQAIRNDCALPENNPWSSGPLMGDAIEWGLNQILSGEDGGHLAYPDEPAERWDIIKRGCGYAIIDNLLGTTFSIPNERL